MSPPRGRRSELRGQWWQPHGAGSAKRREAYLAAGESTSSEVFRLTYAIVETGGKQYRVQEGDTLRVEKLAAGEGESVVFDKVLAISRDGQVTVGTPYLEGAKVTAKVTAHGKAPKIIVFKYRAKKNYRKKTGHRQPFTAVTIESIEG